MRQQLLVQDEAPAVLEMAVTGMHCQHCANYAARILRRLDGVANAVVYLDQKTARVVMQADCVPDEVVVRTALTDASFDPGAARIVESDGDFSV